MQPQGRSGRPSARVPAHDVDILPLWKPLRAGARHPCGTVDDFKNRMLGTLRIYAPGKGEEPNREAAEAHAARLRCLDQGRLGRGLVVRSWRQETHQVLSAG